MDHLYNFLLRDATQSAVMRVYVVCPSVCHTLALCQNDSSYDHAVFTVR